MATLPMGCGGETRRHLAFDLARIRVVALDVEARPERIPAAFAALGSHLLAEQSLDDVLRHVCTVAVEAMDPADEASVTLLVDGEPTTLGATGPLAIAADEAQYGMHGGPCIDSSTANQVVVVPDLAEERRWRATEGMFAAGAGSSLALPLPVQGEAIGALNLYARAPRAFDEEQVALGIELAAYAAVPVANAVSYSDVADATRHLRAAMESRAVIEQAKGIIMGTTGCDADAAFLLLVQQSQHENRKLRDIAVELVERTVRG